MLSVCVTPPDRPLIFKSITSSVTLQTTGKSGKISVKPYPSLCIKLFDERKQSTSTDAEHPLASF